MTFPLENIQGLNIFIVILFIVFIGIGLKKGFLLSLLDLVGTIVIFFISLKLAPVLAANHLIIEDLLNIDVGNDFVNELIYTKSNELAWFLIIFIVGALLVLILKHLCKWIGEIPLIKQINRLLGGVLGFIKAYLISLIMIFVFSTPLVKNGAVVIERSYLGVIEDKSTLVLNMLGNPEEFTNMLQDIMNGNGIDLEYAEKFEEWLKKYIDDEQIIKQIINQFVNSNEFVNESE